MQECNMIGFVERLDDEHVGVDWFPGHGDRDVTGKNPGMLPKLKCAAAEPDFLQRWIDRTRERIRARHRHSAGLPDGDTNHPRGGSDRPKRKAQPAVADDGAHPENGADDDDIPL